MCEVGNFLVMLFKFFIYFFNISLVQCISCNIFTKTDCKLVTQTNNKFCTKPEFADEWAFINLFQIQNCKITELGSELFKNYNFTDIYVEDNNISVVRSYTFMNLNIYHLSLQNNNIITLEINAFYELIVEYDIQLSNNKIVTLNSLVFFHVHCDCFKFFNNSITSVKKEDLDFVISHITCVNMEENPIKYFDTLCFVNKSICKFSLSYYPTNVIQEVCKNKYSINNILQMCDEITFIPGVVRHGTPCFLIIIVLIMYLIFRVRQNNSISPLT